MAESFYLLADELPPGSLMERNSTGYFVENAGGDLGMVIADVPRFQYLAGLGGTAYLSEPAYTNLFTAPEDFTNGAWVHLQAGGDVTVNANVATAPDGTVTADRLNFIAASADIGLAQSLSPLTNGAKYMTSVYVLKDALPDDVRLKHPVSAADVVNGTALATWQRITRLDTVTGTVSGLYIRRNAGLNGSLFLWGAASYANSAGKIFNYHPSAFVGDSLRVKNIALDGVQGTVGLTFVPKFAASGEISVAETVLMDWARDGLKLTWAGDANPSYLRLYNNGVVVATFATRHAVDDILEIRVHFGGTETRPHLEVNSVLAKANADWVTPIVPPEAFVGCDADGNQCHGLYTELTADTVRRVPVERWGSLGDAISAEPYAAATASWNIRAGLFLSDQSKQILIAGVTGNTLALMATRVQADIIDQGVTTCIVFGGYGDLIADRTLGQMQTSFNTITTALAAAGVRVVVCTILPFGGSPGYSAPREAIRVAFNAWLSGAANVDSVIDTSTALEDSMAPTQLDALYDSGDHIHPNLAGSELIADTILAVECPPSGVNNPSFERPYQNPGTADGWTMSFTASVEQIAVFDSTTSAVEDFDSEWRLPNTSGLYTNEFSLFSFEDSVHLEAGQFSGLSREDFEFGWDNDAGFYSNFDALTTIAATFDTALVGYEDFEHEWDSNETALGGFEPFFVSTAVGPFTISASANNTMLIDFAVGGSPSLTATITPGTYATASAMAVRVQAALDAAVGMECDLVVSVTAAGYIQITATGAYSRFRLRTPVSGSAWSTLGFVSHGLTSILYDFRAQESVTLSRATFDTALTNQENFENEWRSNELSVFTFILVGGGTASFDNPGAQNYDSFEGNWTTTLVL